MDHSKKEGKLVIIYRRFTQILIEVDGAQEGLQCWIFENDLLSAHSFRQNLGKRKVKYVQKILIMVEPFMIIEEKLTTRYDNPTSSEYHSDHPSGKESH